MSFQSSSYVIHADFSSLYLQTAVSGIPQLLAGPPAPVGNLQ